MNASEITTYLQQMEDLLARLQRIMSHDRVLKQFNMTASQMFILRYLNNCNRAKASDIAKVAGLSPGAVTQVCDELERSQWVERTRSSEDRRVVYVSITSQGQSRLDEIRKLRSNNMMDIFTRLGEHDAGEFVRIMGKVVAIVEERQRVVENPNSDSEG